MSELKKLQIRYNGRVVDAFLLGIYDREYYQFQPTFWERLFFRKTKSKIKTILQKTYLAFIPWKHREKQVVEVTETDILPFDEVFPSEWISIPKFSSVGTEELRPTMTIHNFFGYQFIFQNNSFIVDQICAEYETTLTILYSELPELLNEEFDEDNSERK